MAVWGGEEGEERTSNLALENPDPIFVVIFSSFIVLRDKDWWLLEMLFFFFSPL